MLRIGTLWSRVGAYSRRKHFIHYYADLGQLLIKVYSHIRVGNRDYQRVAERTHTYLPAVTDLKLSNFVVFYGTKASKRLAGVLDVLVFR